MQVKNRDRDGNIYLSLRYKEVGLHLSTLAYLLTLGRTVFWSLDSSSRNLASSSCGTVRRGSEGAKAEGEGTGKGEGGGEGRVRRELRMM